MSSVARPATGASPGSADRRSPLTLLADLRIGVKILMLAGLAVVLTAIVGLTGEIVVGHVADNGKKIATVTAARQVTAMQLQRDWARHRRFILDVPFSTGAASQTAAANVQSSDDKVLAGVTTLESGASAEEKTILASLRTTIADTDQLYQTKFRQSRQQ